MKTFQAIYVRPDGKKEQTRHVFVAANDMVEALGKLKKDPIIAKTVKDFPLTKLSMIREDEAYLVP